jgi:hypothetical protein
MVITIENFGPGVWRKVKKDGAGHQVDKSAARDTEADARRHPAGKGW